MSRTVSAGMVEVEVVESAETLHTFVSRVVDDEYYEIPVGLVLAYEDARDAYEAAQNAINEYIEVNGLEPRNWYDGAAT